MKHFFLKTEWFDVSDCATITVVVFQPNFFVGCEELNIFKKSKQHMRKTFKMKTNPREE